jgi:hypothetical protein
MSLKSTPPSSSPSGGLKMSLTKDVAKAPKATPMVIPTAMSIRLPLTANSLNSFSMATPVLGTWEVR